MPEKTIAQKLLIKEGRTVLLVNAPRGYQDMLGALPTGAKILKPPAKRADVIQLFVANRAELEARLPKVKEALMPGGLLWVSYYKGTAKTKTDINRDTLHAYARTVGLEGVALVSIDDDWSAMRFKLL
jgi:hypothetical protein